MFWARAVDRARHWTDVMRKLDGEGQVRLRRRKKKGRTTPLGVCEGKMHG